MADTDPGTRKEQPTSEPKTTRLGLIAGLAAVLIAAAVAYWGLNERNSKFPQKSAGPEASAPKSSSVSLGGPFSLTDHNGRAVTDKSFHGKFMLVMFGYTYCPDVCPTQLSTASDAIDALGEAAENVTPVFISIDPERDTVEHLKEYVSYFHPSLIAMTGSAEQIKSVAKAYRVYYAKSGENKDDPEDYLMDHSAITYLIGRNGEFLAHFSHGTDAETLAKRIREYL